MLAGLFRRKDALPWPVANDNRPGCERIADVAAALRGAFPNITPAQAEQAALQLTAGCRPAGHRAIGPRRSA